MIDFSFPVSHRISTEQVHFSLMFSFPYHVKYGLEPIAVAGARMD